MDDKIEVFIALKTFKKHNNETSGLNALSVLYNLAQQRNLCLINSCMSL